jgi:hypothetical protein
MCYKKGICSRHAACRSFFVCSDVGGRRDVLRLFVPIQKEDRFNVKKEQAAMKLSALSFQTELMVMAYPLSALR